MQTLIANPTVHTMVFMVLAAIIINIILSPLARIAGRKYRANKALDKRRAGLGLTTKSARNERGNTRTQAHRPIVVHVHIHTNR